VAQIEQVCDSVGAGDYLEPFVAPTPVAGEINTTANLDFSSLGRVLFGDEQRRIAGPGDFMMLERGATDMAPGTHVAVYRDLKTAGVPLAAIGEGVIVTMANGTPRVAIMTDAIGWHRDFVVPHK
jgi:hypothetical protein